MAAARVLCGQTNTPFHAANNSDSCYNQYIMVFNGDWEQYRKEMLAETEEFIERGLKDPDSVNFIPAKPVNRGSFPTRAAKWFYKSVFFRE